MNSFPTELIYVVAFAAVLLVQYLLKRFAPQEQYDDAAHDTPLDQKYEEVKEAPTAAPRLTVGYFGRSEAPNASVVLSRPRFAKISLMGTRREMQNAIVIATILGPCRANEPHDVR